VPRLVQHVRRRQVSGRGDHVQEPQASGDRHVLVHRHRDHGRARHHGHDQGRRPDLSAAHGRSLRQGRREQLGHASADSQLRLRHLLVSVQASLAEASRLPSCRQVTVPTASVPCPGHLDRHRHHHRLPLSAQVSSEVASPRPTVRPGCQHQAAPAQQQPCSRRARAVVEHVGQVLVHVLGWGQAQDQDQVQALV